MWTRFMDMHSGGGCKESPYEYIYIEASEAEAKVIFYNKFGHNPDRVTCTCCGNDYSIEEEETLERASGYQRGCHYGYFNSKGEEVTQEEAWVSGKGLKRGYGSGYIERKSERSYGGEYQTLAQYKKSKNVLIIPASKIKSEWRTGDVPTQGYVWAD